MTEPTGPLVTIRCSADDPNLTVNKAVLAILRGRIKRQQPSMTDDLALLLARADYKERPVYVANLRADSRSALESLLEPNVALIAAMQACRDAQRAASFAHGNDADLLRQMFVAAIRAALEEI